MSRILVLVSLLAACCHVTVAQVVVRPGGQHAVLVPRSGEELARFAAPLLGGQAANVATHSLGSGWHHVRCTWSLSTPVAQNDLAVEFTFTSQPDDQWMPHLTPIPGVIAAQRIFRSPAIIALFGRKVFTAIPDLALVGRDSRQPWYLDFDRINSKCWIGMSRYDTPAHVLFTKAPGMQFDAGRVELAFFVKVGKASGEPRNLWRDASEFLWHRYGRPAFAAGRPHSVPMAKYVGTAYEWAFDRWERQCWLEGGDVGAVRFVTDFSESPTAGIPPFTDRFDAVWNQAWYCSLRSAGGMFRWARHTGDADLAERAQKTKRLALSAPRREGIFPSVLFVDGVPAVDNEFAIEESQWTNSSRSPRELGVSRDWYHVLDASNTALWMLRWYRDLEADPALREYVRTYVDWVVTRQGDDGFFPAWLHPNTLVAHPTLADSPETARTAMLLLEYADLFGLPAIEAAGLRALDAVLAGPARENRWEDFETYWSDNFFGRATNVGVPFLRNGLYKQNTLSIFWTCEACLAAHRMTGDPRYLEWGIALLDQLAMWQQVWRPPFMSLPTLGGFGVMNADAEWNDARQSLFAELFLDYYVETGERSYFERGVAALKASFLMMYTPLNPETKAQWEYARPTLTAWDYGFQMENYAHDEESSPRGGGLSFFSIFDWGCGSAAEAFTRITQRFGHVYIDTARRNGFGIDSLTVARLPDGRWQITTREPLPRDISIRFDDGRLKWVRLDRVAVVDP